MTTPDPALVAAIRDAIDCEPLPSIHRLDCHCSPRDDASCLELRELLAACVASWVGPLEGEHVAAGKFLGPGGNIGLSTIRIDPAVEKLRLAHNAALAALPWRKEEPHG